MGKPKSKDKTSGYRRLEGKEVKPVLYAGKYMSGSVDGKMVVDKQGVPLQYRQIGVSAAEYQVQKLKDDTA